MMSLRSLLSWVYLAFAGSLIGFTAYIYLLNTVSAAKAATYAYVNPVIAVLLGWAFANEAIGVRTLVAAGITLGGRDHHAEAKRARADRRVSHPDGRAPQATGRKAPSG